MEANQEVQWVVKEVEVLQAVIEVEVRQPVTEVEVQKAATEAEVQQAVHTVITAAHHLAAPVVEVGHTARQAAIAPGAAGLPVLHTATG